MKKLTKSQVIALTKQNNTLVVYLIPSKCQLSGYKTWITPYQVTLISDRNGNIHQLLGSVYELRSFEKLINEYEYYNCNSETGNRVHYYIKEKES